MSVGSIRIAANIRASSRTDQAGGTQIGERLVDHHEAAAQLADQSLNVLDLLGVFMHVIGRDVRLVGEIQFPKSMVADDGGGERPVAGGNGELPEVGDLRGADGLQPATHTGEGFQRVAVAGGALVGGGQVVQHARHRVLDALADLAEFGFLLLGTIAISLARAAGMPDLSGTASLNLAVMTQRLGDSERARFGLRRIGHRAHQRQLACRRVGGGERRAGRSPRPPFRRTVPIPPGGRRRPVQRDSADPGDAGRLTVQAAQACWCAFLC